MSPRQSPHRWSGLFSLLKAGRGKFSRVRVRVPIRPRAASSAPIGPVQPPPGPVERLKSRPVARPSAPPIYNVKMRLTVVVGFFMLAFFVLAARAVHLVVFQGKELREKALSQHQRKIITQPHRGRFLDRSGHPLAISLPVKSLSVDISHVKEPIALADRLAPLVGVDKQRLRYRLKKAKPNSYPILARKLPPGVIHKIRNMNDPALFFIPDMQRFYPLGEITGHIIGFVGFDGLGAEGLEKMFQKELQGQPASRIITHDRMGRVMPKVQNLSEGHPGSDIVLTIDATIQYIAYRALLKGVTRNRAKAGSVVVLDPRTGDVLAMVNQPAFNPNNMLESQSDTRRNRAIMDAYEPGSTFKIFTIGAGLDTGVVKESTVVDIEGGRLKIGDRVIRDFHAGMNHLSIGQIIQKSSNVGAAKVGLMMKVETLEQYIHNFGFAKPTGVEQTNEAAGSLADITHYRHVGQANRSYGYGVTATPLQIATAVAAAVNGGLLRPPHLVAGRMINDRQIPIPRVEPRRVISDKTSAIMRRILAMVVSTEGTAVQAKVNGYTVAGKTGTARKASGRHGYQSGSYFASFVGFIPAEDPKLLIFVGIDEPDTKQYYGGLAAAPIFREIAEEALPLLGVLPSTPVELKLPAAREEVKPPAPETKTASASGMELPSPPPPSLVNLSLSDALERSIAQGVVPLLHGSGRVVREQQEKDGEGAIRLMLE
ncbi:MAG: penicillin-binding protein 2 [Magnetococcales bacterium]|nr:penicillin-binding protein 2 [Magnetococcales bacterium]